MQEGSTSNMVLLVAETASHRRIARRDNKHVWRLPCLHLKHRDEDKIDYVGALHAAKMNRTSPPRPAQPQSCQKNMFLCLFQNPALQKRRNDSLTANPNTAHQDDN